MNFERLAAAVMYYHLGNPTSHENQMHVQLKVLQCHLLLRKIKISLDLSKHAYKVNENHTNQPLKPQQ